MVYKAMELCPKQFHAGYALDADRMFEPDKNAMSVIPDYGGGFLD